MIPPTKLNRRIHRTIHVGGFRNGRKGRPLVPLRRLGYRTSRIGCRL